MSSLDPSSQQKIKTDTVSPDLSRATMPATEKVVEVGGGSQLQIKRNSPASALVVEDVKPNELKSTAAPMLDVLKQKKGGEAYVEKAEKLAESVTLDNLKALLEYGQQSRDTLASVSDEMIGDRRMGSAGPVGQLFSDLNDFKNKLDIGAVTHPKPWTTMLTHLPFVGGYLEPVYRFGERFKKLRPEIDKKEQTIKELEVARTVSQEELKTLQETTLDGFAEIEVAIAAGEIALSRELKRFTGDCIALKDSEDIVAKQELRSRKMQILNLDNRLMKLQTARMDAIADMPLIDIAIANEEKLRSTLEDLRVVTIPQIRKSVAIALRIQDQREAAALGLSVDELNAALREANLTALDMAQTETHQNAIAAAQDVDRLVAAMEKLSEILKHGNELMNENQQMNKDAREKLQAAETKFKQDLEDNLQDLVRDALGVK